MVVCADGCEADRDRFRRVGAQDEGGVRGGGPFLWDAWSRDPENSRAGGNGESGREAGGAAGWFFSEVLSRHSGQTILVVGHNGTNRLYMAYKLGMPLRNYRRLAQENSAITLFELDGSGEFTLKCLNA
ncbi:histidine phosphatase family protein [Puia sp. P3]|uniref:histidine phosphatase family protein n=1 Tax=Puia sp. P3 TaxID=3423952 RepID=UPI003D67E89D